VSQDPAGAWLIRDLATFELKGRTFTMVRPSPFGIAEGEDGRRLVAGVFSGSVQHHNGIEVVPVLEPGAVDLGLVRSGRCPIVVEHRYSLDELLGAVDEAWLADGQLHVVGRLARTPAANRLWRLLRQGFPLSLSLGWRVNDAEPVGERSWRATRWTLAEASVVVFGRDEDAHVRYLDQDPEAFAEFRRGVQASIDDARVAVSRRLHLDKWESWSLPTAFRLADALGADRGHVHELLAAEVQSHIGKL
jgi:hypothetical protein